MSMVRALALSGLPELYKRLGGDPEALLRSAGIGLDDVDRPDMFVPLPRSLAVLETAAALTGTPDLGRQLARRRGVEILGPVAVAARTAATAADALVTFQRFLSTYSPGFALHLRDADSPDHAFIEFGFVDKHLPPHTQATELYLGMTLRILRFLLGPGFDPISVHLPHEPLTRASDYRRYYGSTAHFGQSAAGFTVDRADLHRPLRRERLAHEAVLQYLSATTGGDDDIVRAVSTLIHQLLPSGTATLNCIATHLNLHPKALQRKLAAQGTTFAAIIDQMRRDRAELLLRDTHITLSHVARHLGYAQQAVLTRSCQRWFGSSPTDLRKGHRAEQVRVAAE
jgi:AraC-like DNA-binding protein